MARFCFDGITVGLYPVLPISHKTVWFKEVNMYINLPLINCNITIHHITVQNDCPIKPCKLREKAFI
jgi:hypothetical protein